MYAGNAALCKHVCGVFYGVRFYNPVWGQARGRRWRTRGRTSPGSKRARWQTSGASWAACAGCGAPRPRPTPTSWRPGTGTRPRASLRASAAACSARRALRSGRLALRRIGGGQIALGCSVCLHRPSPEQAE